MNELSLGELSYAHGAGITHVDIAWYCIPSVINTFGYGSIYRLDAGAVGFSVGYALTTSVLDPSKSRLDAILSASLSPARLGASMTARIGEYYLSRNDPTNHYAKALILGAMIGVSESIAVNHKPG